MMEIQVRRATPGDADAIASLLHQLGYPAASAEVAGRLHRMSLDDRALVLVAGKDGKVVGLATAHILSVLNRSRDVAWLTALVVDESVRGTGVGRLLVKAVEDFARQSGCERLSVTTHKDRLPAREFYARIGLEETGRRFSKTLTF
jgi:predicted N-acetyltransferase YhbS